MMKIELAINCEKLLTSFTVKKFSNMNVEKCFKKPFSPLILIIISYKLRLSHSGTIVVLWYEMRLLWTFIKGPKLLPLHFLKKFYTEKCQGFPKRYCKSILVNELQNCGPSKLDNFELLNFREYSPVHHYIRDLNAGMPQHRFFRVFLTPNFEGPQFCSPLTKIDL